MVSRLCSYMLYHIRHKTYVYSKMFYEVSSDDMAQVVQKVLQKCDIGDNEVDGIPCLIWPLSLNNGRPALWNSREAACRVYDLLSGIVLQHWQIKLTHVSSMFRSTKISTQFHVGITDVSANFTKHELD